MAAQDRKGPRKTRNPDDKSPKHSGSDLARLIKAVFDMKAEMGCMRKALMNAGISVETFPTVQKTKEQFVN